MSEVTGRLFDELVAFDEAVGQGPIAGVDEAGRGALAGPVVAAAVICEPHEELLLVRDSKKLSEPARENVYEIITRRASAVGVGIVGPERIDEVNILKATMEAMRDAITALAARPELVLVDGPRLPETRLTALSVTGGDGKSFSIAAASIVAKVTRDRLMREIDAAFPQYRFSRNKGYGTREHRRAIMAWGRTSVHRHTFNVSFP